MTNPLDFLLDSLEDALEEAETPLWQPDLTDLLLPGLRDIQTDTEQGKDNVKTHSAQADVLSAFFFPDTWQALSGSLWIQGGSAALSGQSSSPAQTSTLEMATQFSSPSLLVQLQRLERTQAGIEGLSRGQSVVHNLSARSGTGQGGTDILYHSAALEPFPLSASAAAQAEDQARAVDRAFQRDSRRYDRGFSLY